MKDKVFLDTNIFVYAIDTSPDLKAKSEIAKELVADHLRNESGVISIQVFQEFYNTSTRKIETPISTEDALEFMRYMATFETVIADFEMVETAVRLHQKHSVSFWDALIVEAARTAGCTQLLSEDLQHGFRLDGLTVKNPFSQ